MLTGEKRQNPHVQSYVVAVDQTALELVREDPTVLRCYNRYHDAVWWVVWLGGSDLRRWLEVTICGLIVEMWSLLGVTIQAGKAGWPASP